MTDQSGSDRSSLLDPNEGSKVKVERYQMPFSKRIVLGIPTLFDIGGQPDTVFRPQRIVANAPQRGMFYFRDIRVANVCCFIGSGDIDAYDLAEVPVDYPTLTPANRMRMTVEYTGLWPRDLREMPRPDLTAQHLLEVIEEAIKESYLPQVRASLRGALEKIPLFTFTVAAAGPSSMVG